MAEALCRKSLSERLGCSEADLEARGFRVESAGVAAMAGMEASPEAVQVVAEFGGDLTSHRSQPISLEMLQEATWILAMTDGHLRLLMSVELPTMPVADLLSPQGTDVRDPIGGTVEDYRACAQDILTALDQRLPDFLSVD